MKTKSFPVRSSRKPLDHFPERVCSGEIVSDTCDEKDVPHKKRHYPGTSETGRDGEGESKFDTCIVCEISDMRVSRCSGMDCFVRFHEECLTPEFGGSEDLSNPFCPYCWFKIVVAKSESLRAKAIEAEKAVFKYLDKESVPKAQEDTILSGDQELQGDKAAAYSSKEEQEEGIGKLELGTGKSRDMEEDDKVRAEVEVSKDEEMVDTDNFQDAEVNRTKGNTGAGKKGGLSPFLSMQESFPGKEHGQVQQNERRRRRLIKLRDIDNETSSSKERDGEDVTELITSSLSVEMNNQQRKLAAATSKTVRDISFFNKDQRRRLLWTSEEEEMLKAGVEKFAAEANKKMPWRKILEMGENVFHQSRSPSDLKDKWRNMIKALH